MIGVRLGVAMAAAGICLGSVSAHAAPEFGYVYTADTEEAGETELSLWATDRRGKSPGDYAAQDYRVEVERGITDRFQASLYANFAGHQIRNFIRHCIVLWFVSQHPRVNARLGAVVGSRSTTKVDASEHEA